MKQSPYLARAQKDMQPGVISKIGFLGEDERDLQDILEEDTRTVAALGLTHEQIADFMHEVTRAGRESFGSPVKYNDYLEVMVETSRGRITCPFGHPGMYPKENVQVTNTRTGESIAWTALNEHMIRHHGFYQGKGSPFRVEPEDIVRVLEIKE